MIVVDSSAWIEFLRDTGSPTSEGVIAVIDADLAITDAISMEILAGARDEHHLGMLRRLLARTTILDTTADDYDHAAALYRTCRRNGATVRKLIDCLIAAVAIRHSVPILENDADFHALERFTDLRLHKA